MGLGSVVPIIVHPSFSLHKTCGEQSHLHRRVDVSIHMLRYQLIAAIQLSQAIPADHDWQITFTAHYTISYEKKIRVYGFVNGKGKKGYFYRFVE